MRAELRSIGEVKNMLVEGIVAASWRLRRLGCVEAGMFTWEHYEVVVQRAEQEARTYELKAIIPPPTIVPRDKQKYEESLSKAEKAKAEQEAAETATLGRTFIRDATQANAFSKLSRYETARERSLYRTLYRSSL